MLDFLQKGILKTIKCSQKTSRRRKTQNEPYKTNKSECMSFKLETQFVLYHTLPDSPTPTWNKHLQHFENSMNSHIKQHLENYSYSNICDSANK